MPEGVSSFQERKCIYFKNENIWKSIKKYKYQIDFLHETNEGLVVANKILREDIKEINSHYQKLIVVSKEALKRKRQTQTLCAELKQTIQEVTHQNKELSKRFEDLEAEQQWTRRKTQALEGKALLDEASKDL